MKLNDTERKVFNDLLDRFSEMLGNAGCNDLDLPATKEGQALANEVAVYLASDSKDEPQNPAPLCTFDWAVLGVLRKKVGLNDPEDQTSQEDKRDAVVAAARTLITRRENPHCPMWLDTEAAETLAKTLSALDTELNN